MKKKCQAEQSAELLGTIFLTSAILFCIEISLLVAIL